METMKILCIVPPYVPSYFNAGHHLAIFQVAAYLRKKRNALVTARDLGAANATWRDVCELLVQRFDVIAMLNDFDAIDGFERFVGYVRSISPMSRLVTFGRGSRQVPGFFKRYEFDAIVSSGDHETGVAGYIDYLRGVGRPVGVLLRDHGYSPVPPGALLDPEEWALPEIGEIPYESYDRLYSNDLSKFCGVPGRRELVVPLARGCPVGCEFCDVPAQQGLKERRMTVETTIRYIEECFKQHPFEYVSFYAPTFTLKRSWVLQLCSAIRARLPSLKWKCVTTLAHLDNDLIQELGHSGCVRVSVGVESFGHNVANQLPKLKRDADKRLSLIADDCARARIEINCFVMIGMDGESIASAAETVNTLIDRGFRVRPTVFTPYQDMSEHMSVSDYSSFNRQLLRSGIWTPEECLEAYDLLYANSRDKATLVATRISTKRLCM
jgi:anaerobic magnesium-protoporphyrin IX monomethyl ester cyclase